MLLYFALIYEFLFGFSVGTAFGKKRIKFIFKFLSSNYTINFCIIISDFFLERHVSFGKLFFFFSFTLLRRQNLCSILTWELLPCFSRSSNIFFSSRLVSSSFLRQPALPYSVSYLLQRSSVHFASANIQFCPYVFFFLRSYLPASYKNLVWTVFILTI